MKAVIYPKKINVQSPDTPDEKDYNYKLATYIKEKIEAKGGEASIARKSAAAPEINPVIIKESENPDVFIRFSDNFTGGGRYIISCDAYSALAGALNNDLNTTWGAPSGSGLKVTETLDFSKLNDIEIGFDSLSTLDDAALTRLASRMVEAFYWHPVKNNDTLDTPNNIDPYIYRFSDCDTWHEENYAEPAEDSEGNPLVTGFKLGQDYTGCSGTFKEEEVTETYGGKEVKIPLKYLRIVSAIPQGKKYNGEHIAIIDPGDPSADPPIPPTYEDEPATDVPLQHYTWTIPTTGSASTLKFCTRGTGSGSIYIKVGTKGARYYPDHKEGDIVNPAAKNTNYFSTTISPIPTSWTIETVNIPSTITAGSIEIGLEGSGQLDITGVWLTSKADTYNKYPNGYRDIPTKKQETVPTTPIPALTLSYDMFGKAADKIAVPEPDPGKVEAENPTDGSSPSSPEGFESAIGGIMEQMTSNTEGVSGLVDLNSTLKLDTSTMVDQVKNKTNFAERLNLSTAKDKLDSLVSGAQQQADQLIKRAEDKVKGKSASLTPAKINAGMAGKLPKMPSKPPVPSADSLKGQAMANADFTAKAKGIQDTADKMKADLQPKLDTSIMDSKVAAAKEQAASITNAINQAKSTAQTSTNGISLNSIKGKI